MLKRHLLYAGLLVCASFTAISAAAAPSMWAVTPEKVGPLKFGMSIKDAFKAMGAEDALTPELIEGALTHCEEITVPGQIDTIMMFENAKLSSLTFYGDSPLKTTLGIGIGASESEVMAKYPKAVTTPRPPVETARDLTFWTKVNISGIRFQTDSSRVVESIHVGGQSITYTGGCA